MNRRTHGPGAIAGIGTDVVDVDRLARSLANPRFAAAVFSDGERSHCASHSRPELHLATCFAAKEAFLKAVGRGLFDRVALADIELVVATNGAPSLRLGPSAARALAAGGASGALVTLSRSGRRVMAFVVAQ